MAQVKTIALVAHDNKKRDLIEWLAWNYKTLINHQLVCTGTTGKLVERAIKKKLEEGGGRRLDFSLSFLMAGKNFYQQTQLELAVSCLKGKANSKPIFVLTERWCSDIRSSLQYTGTRCESVAVPPL